MKKVIIDVYETWYVECPKCYHTQRVIDEYGDSGSSIEMICEDCGEKYLAVLERE